jgi:16S rRNA C967 or C1407 C5-methylase (RsmB/RsmF family)/NOL1/NOP2/fmu family ribosome biogenesis protein
MSISFPPDFISTLQRLPGFKLDDFLEAHEKPAPVSIRVNPAKPIDPVAYFSNCNSSRIPWTTNGWYLSERPSFTLDPLFHSGSYYVQEAGSMFLEQAISTILQHNQIHAILDLCAAPGGKSTHLHELLPKDSIIVSNEVIKTRQHILMENWVKWGAKNVMVTGNDPKDFQRLPDYFDAIVVDAPCSGSGMFRKDPDAIGHWSVMNVNHCAQRQERILEDVLPALKPGGFIVYSTCSYAPEENEEMLDKMMERYNLESVNIQLDPFWGITETRSAKFGGFGYRCYPHLCKGEGFFLTLLKKSADHNLSIPYKADHKKSPKSKNDLPVEVKNSWPDWLNVEEGEVIMKWKDQLLVMNKNLANQLPFLQQQLYIRAAGIDVGEVGLKDFIPHHGIAMGGLLPDSFPRLGLNLDQSLQLLRHQHVELETDARGWMLMCHQQHSISLVKLLPNRINNYYPRDWRILNK